VAEPGKTFEAAGLSSARELGALSSVLSRSARDSPEKYVTADRCSQGHAPCIMHGSLGLAGFLAHEADTRLAQGPSSLDRPYMYGTWCIVKSTEDLVYRSMMAVL
jgi:hypothetical protein